MGRTFLNTSFINSRVFTDGANWGITRDKIFENHKIEINKNFIDSNQVYDCASFITKYFDENDFTPYFPEGLKDLKSLVFIIIEQEDSKGSYKALLTMLLPYTSVQLKKSNYTEFPFKKIYKHLHLENNKKCDKRGSFCNCEVNIKKATQIEIPDKKDEERIYKTMIDKLETKMCKELGFQRVQIWTLKYLFDENEGKGKYYFVLPKEKRKPILKYIRNERKDIPAKKIIKEFNKNWNVFNTKFHDSDGIIGDTQITNLAEVLINPWFDQREKRLLEKRAEILKEEDLSKAEYYFYGKYFKEYTVIPIIVHNYYWGAVMFFNEGRNKKDLTKRIDDNYQNYFFEINRKAIYIVQSMVIQFETLLLQICLQYSSKLILLNDQEIKEYLKKRYPFWPEINICNGEKEIQKFMKDYNLLENNADGSKTCINIKNEKCIIRTAKTPNSDNHIVFEFPYIVGTIPITLSITCDLFVNEVEYILSLQQSRINEEIAFCAVRAISHFEGTNVYPPGKWDEMNRQIMSFVYNEIDNDKLEYTKNDNAIHSSEEKIFQECVDIAQMIFDVHIKPINELIKRVLEDFPWYRQEVYNLYKDCISTLCYDKYFVFPTGLFEQDNPPKKFEDIDQLEIKKIIHIKCDEKIKCRIYQPLLQFILVNLIRNTVTKSMITPHPLTSPGLIISAQNINLEFTEEDEYINMKYWDDAKWDESVLSDKCKAMNKYFTAPRRDEKDRLQGEIMKGFAFRAIYLFLNKIPSNYKQTEFIKPNGQYIWQEFHIPIIY